MKKQKTKFFETPEFTSREVAEQFFSRTGKKLGDCRRALPVAIVGSASSVTAFLLWDKLELIAGLLFLAALACAIASFIIGGGILTTIKWAWKLALAGWFIAWVPFVDICVGVMVFIVALGALFFLPIVGVGLNYLQYKQDYEYAALLLHGRVVA